MIDQPVTPDREALEAAALDGLHRWDCFEDDHTECRRGAGKVLDAVLPLLTDALDRARQRGREEAAEAIEVPLAMIYSELRGARALTDENLEWLRRRNAKVLSVARGGPNRKDEE